jgi:hypothetical protein
MEIVPVPTENIGNAIYGISDIFNQGAKNREFRDPGNIRRVISVDVLCA